jgi:hypothetical protein
MQANRFNATRLSSDDILEAISASPVLRGLDFAVKINNIKNSDIGTPILALDLAIGKAPGVTELRIQEIARNPVRFAARTRHNSGRFDMFPRLPAELRAEIIQLLVVPRLVVITEVLNPFNGLRTVVAPPRPYLMNINREIRDLMERVVYQFKFQVPNSERVIYFRPEIDVLHFGTSFAGLQFLGPLVPFITIPMILESPKKITLIRRLNVDLYNFKYGFEWFCRSWSMMRELQSFNILGWIPDLSHEGPPTTLELFLDIQEGNPLLLPVCEIYPGYEMAGPEALLAIYDFSREVQLIIFDTISCLQTAFNRYGNVCFPERTGLRVTIYNPQFRPQQSLLQHTTGSRAALAPQE